MTPYIEKKKKWEVESEMRVCLVVLLQIANRKISILNILNRVESGGENEREIQSYSQKLSTCD